MQVECNFAELVDLLNSDRICSLEVTWILEDISIIKDSLVLISFSSIHLHCNCAALALANGTKVKEDVIIWLEKCPSFLFLIVQSDLHNKIYYRFYYKKNKKIKIRVNKHLFSFTLISLILLNSI